MKKKITGVGYRATVSVWIGLSPCLLLSQVTTATISGIVRDTSGAVVPRAEVAVRNMDTGISRTLVSDAEGRYLAPNLGLGRYEVKAEAAGFQTELRTGITLTVGQHAVIDFTLRPGAVAESVTVTGEAPLVETATSSVAALVDQKQIHELPLNGRSYTQLALLQPGVILYREQRRVPNKGMGIRMSIAGARPTNVGWRLNGLDIADMTGSTPGSATGSNLGVDAIQEFQVLANNFSAEHGKAAGGVVNIALKSGTNELHGSVFEYLRNDKLDARGFFDGRKPSLKRNQFGFSLGGPVRRDRTFFFGSYEALRQREQQTRISNVITREAKQGRLTIGGVPTIIEVHPSVKPYLETTPDPNGKITPEGVGEYVQSIPMPTGENYFVVKMDHAFSGADSLSGSYSYDRGRLDGPRGSAGLSLNPEGLQNRFQYASLHAMHIFSPTTLNTLRIGFNRSNMVGFSDPAENWPKSLWFIPGVPPGGGIEIPGLATLAAVDGSAQVNPFYTAYEVGDTLALTRGSHSIKLGGNGIRSQYQYYSGGRTVGGTYGFRSLPDFLQARPFRFQGDDPAVPWPPHLFQSLFGFFVQDDIRWTPRLTVNAGLRYEFITLPHYKVPLASNLAHLTDATLTTTERFLGRNPSLRNFAPRIGFAWDVFGNQKTALRAGFGLYHDQITSFYTLQVSTNNPPFSLIRTLNNPPFPNAYGSISAGALPSLFSLSLLQYNIEQPYRIQYNLGVQHEVLPQTLLSVNYVGAHGVHTGQLFTQMNTRIPTKLPDGRLFFALTAPQLNPRFGVIQYRATGGDSYYHSLQMMVNRRLSGGAQVQASYTWSKNMDTGDVFINANDGFTGVSLQNPWNSKSERGLSMYDARHNFSLNTLYDLPLGRDWSGLGRVLGTGWQVGGILSLATGHPFTASVGIDQSQRLARTAADSGRPDLAPGRSNNPVNPGNVDQYFDPTAFVLQQAGTLGNLGRGTLIGPGLAQIDFTMKKRFRVSESSLLEFRADAFNLFNRPNFRAPGDDNRQLFVGAGQRNPRAGRITDLATTARQMQFSMRLEF